MAEYLLLFWVLITILEISNILYFYLFCWKETDDTD